MISENENDVDSIKSILKRSDAKPFKKNVSILDDLSIIDNEPLVSFNDNRSSCIFEAASPLCPDTCLEFKFQDRCTSPENKFSMEDFLSTLDTNIDINKINEYEISEEILNNGKLRSVNCNTYYTNDVYTLHNVTIGNQDKKKTKEERKKEREKKKEEEMLKKYQIEQEAKHRAIAKSKCGRWVKFNIKIGEGGYKFVYRGYDVEEAKNVAWCEFKREHVDTKEKRQSMFRETEIMLKMNHSHIVRCFDVLREWHVYEDQQTIIDEKGIVIIQELMGEGTLKNIIKKNFLEGQCILKFHLITRWWNQILDALRYMHLKCDPPIIHRDLKADNCFLYGQTDDEYLNVKVGDFGLATHVHTSGRKTMLGTLGFMAPEIFDEKYDESVDIYAFGMLMLEVMTNRTPFDECDTIVQVAAKTLSGKGPKVIEMVMDKWLREIINSCIHPLSCFRPTAEELFFHPIFQSKALPVEVELNYDNISDRTEVIDRFIANIPNCTKINLRLRFRDKRMLQELGLDDGESLEFDLDIYKAEDQDIPDLIQNLRLEYEDKLSRVYDNPKIQDKSTISAHLDKLFLSIKLQMQCLVKHLLGRRWRDILDSLVAHKTAKLTEGEMESGDDQDEDCMNSFTIISQYKGMWTKAKRALDKEIVVYRDTPHSDVNSFHFDGKPNSHSKQESIAAALETDNLENGKSASVENPISVKTATQSPIEELGTYSNTTPEIDQMENPKLIQGTALSKSSLQLVSVHGSSTSTNSNSVTMTEIHDFGREAGHTDITMSNDNDHCEADLIKETLNIQKNVSCNVRIQNIESNVVTNHIRVTFNVEIPDFSKSESGKWIVGFKCVVNENSSIIDNFELSMLDGLSDKMDGDVYSALQETILCILKLIQTDKKSVSINQTFIFYPRKENVFFSELNLDKTNRKGHIQTNVMNQNVIIDEQMSEPIIVQNIEHKPNLIEHPNLENQINIDALFDQESTILLTKRLEDDKYVVKIYGIPAGSAVVINNNGSIQNVKKTTIISPKLDSNENIFVRELDKSDLSMDKAIHILTLLQEKIEELSTKDHHYFSDLTFKILCETKANHDMNKKSQPIDTIDKQKIIEQVLLQKTEIEKLQRQQIELISILSNQQILFPPDIEHNVTANNPNKIISSSDQDILNLQKINNNKMYPNQNNYPDSNFSYGQNFMNQNQMLLNNDPRLFMQNNVYITPEDLEFQNSNTFIMDNAIRNQMMHMKTPINENMIYTSNTPANKDFASLENNMRLKGMKDMSNIGDVNRTYNDIPNACYSNERVEYFDRNMHQLHYHGNEQINDNELHCKQINPVSSVPNIQERISEFKTPDSNLTQQMYPSKYPYYYPVSYQNIRNDHNNYSLLPMKEQGVINYMLPQPMQNYYEPVNVVSPPYPSTDELANMRKDQIIYEHNVSEDIQLNEHTFPDKQMHPESMFGLNNSFSTTDNSNLNYHENNFSINQKNIDKTPEACINIHMNPLEDKTKDVFINR